MAGRRSWRGTEIAVATPEEQNPVFLLTGCQSGLSSVRGCNQHILEALELARRLTILADEGEAAAEDDSCMVLYGQIRDCAYALRRLAEREREAHIARGIWDGPIRSGQVERARGL